MPSAVISSIIDAENMARSVLRSAKTSSIATDLDLLCKESLIFLAKQDLEDSLSGMAFVKDGQRFIVVNKNHHLNRQRFTIAHELGHHVLHSDYLEKNIHVDTLVLNRDVTSKNGVEKKEIEANAFAAELLMPMAKMKKYGSVDIADDNTIKNAADLFHVSTSAFTYRLLNLGNRRLF